MITRAQAEALLTMAESLEACERLGVSLHNDMDHVRLMGPGVFEYVGEPTGKDLRQAVCKLIPQKD